MIGKRNSILDDLKSNLKEYLKEFGREAVAKHNVSCVNSTAHAHGDRHPSASYLEGQGSPVLYCHSCKKVYDIYDCAHFLEGKPLEGKAFWTENVVYLANKFGAKIEQEEISEDQKEVFIKLRAHQHAAYYIVNGFSKTGTVAKMLEDRGIPLDAAKKLKIGGIESYETYINYMLEMGWTQPSLDSFGLTRKDIFNKDNIIFVVCNEQNNAVGFVARDTTWTKEKTGSKYTNSSNSDIYHKGQILYLLNEALDSIPGPLYIVEGYIDAATMHINDIANTASVGSTSFTNDHVRLLHDLGYKSVIFCFDGDQGGKSGIETALSRVSAYNVFDEVKIVEMPNGHDPDSYIRSFGAESFKALEKKSPFEWTLDNMEHNADPEVVCKQAIKIVFNEQSFLTRESMMKSLSKKTGISLEAIRSEMERMVNARESQKNAEIAKIISNMRLKLDTRKDEEVIKDVIFEALNNIRSVEKVFDPDSDMEHEFKSCVRVIQTSCQVKRKLDGYNLPRFPILTRSIDGYADKGCFILLGGKPGAGKTSLFRNWILEILLNNPDVVIIYMSIDDSREVMLPALVAIDQAMPIKFVRNSSIITTPYVKKWHEGWRNLEGLAGRLIVRDASQGTTLDHLERYMDYMIKKNPDKKLMVFLDNFHLLTDYQSGGSTTREQNVKRSKRIKTLAVDYKVPISATVELRKGESFKDIPTPEDISETVQIGYDADLIMLLHNDMHVNRDSQMYWNYTPPADEIEFVKTRQPYLEMFIDKNKKNGFKGKLGYRFIGEYTLAQECGTDEIDIKRSVMYKSSKSFHGAGAYAGQYSSMPGM